MGSFVISWIPLMMMEENIMTAAPPRTLWGMMEIRAASFGKRPQKIRKIAPKPRARAVDDLCHGDKANVLAEGSVRENAEQSSQGRTEAVAGHAAGELFIRSFSAHTALHNAGDIADGLDCCHNEHDQDRQDCPGIEDQFYRHEFWNGEPGSVGYLDQFSTQALVNSTPSAVMSVVGRKIPMTSETI